MASLLSDFGQTAQRLARNPLGIIALFIVLVYGIAGLVLGVSSGNLDPNERRPLVWFLVAFPVVVLAVFYRLVTKHHVKLYAPHDFPDAEGFFRALTPSEQKERREQQLRELEASSSAIEGDKTAGDQMAGTDRIEGLSLRQASFLAEEFAFRELENEFDTSIQRYVSVAGRLNADGIMVHEGIIRIVEVKLTRQVRWAHHAISAAKSFSRLVDVMSRTPYFVLAIVTDGLSPEQVKSEVKRTKEQLKSIPQQIDLRVYDFGELKQKYGLAGDSN